MLIKLRFSLNRHSQKSHFGFNFLLYRYCQGTQNYHLQPIER